MRSEITYSASDGEYERLESDSIHQTHSRAEQSVASRRLSDVQSSDEHAAQEKHGIMLPASANGMSDSVGPKEYCAMEAEGDDATVTQNCEGLQSGSGSDSSSIVEDKDHGAEDSRLAHRKIFVGGLSWQTTEADLRDYFCQFGPIQSCQIKYDAASKQPRGFGFIVFEREESVDQVLAIRDQHRVRGKRVDPKPAKPSKDVSRKVFVGGLDPAATYDQILEYFSQFGKVESLDLPFDNAKCSRKNYVFIAYATKHEALAATRSAKQQICGRMCDVRIAVPRDQILKMQSRAGAGAVPQTPIKFPAPQSMLPSAYVSSRNFSGPAAIAPGSLAPPPGTQLCSQLPIQQDLALAPVPAPAPTRFRTPYRSEPTGCTFTPGATAHSFAQNTPQVVQPNPPFHFALQNTPSAVGQFPAPYQLCVVEQPMQQTVYTPYCTVASQECVQPSVITVSTYPTMVVGPGSPAPTGLVQPLVSPGTYTTYSPYASYTTGCMQPAEQQPATAVYPVNVGNPTDITLASGPEMLQQPDSLMPVQYATQQIVPGVLYAPMSAGCMHPASSNSPHLFLRHKTPVSK